MNLRLVAYEDAGWQQLLPLVYTRTACQLVCGMDTLLDKIRRLAGFAPEIWCRSYLAAVVAADTGLPTNQRLDRSALLLNGRALWSALPPMESGESSWVGTSGPEAQIVCLFADASLAAQITPELLLDPAPNRAILEGLPRRDLSAFCQLLDWTWELVHAHHQALLDDWDQRQDRAAVLGSVAAGSHLLAPESIHIGAGSRVKPGVVIDAEEGPVWIGNQVQIQPHVYIRGPACIEDHTLVQAGTVVREGAFIGPHCKIGGEIEASIIQGFSNKQHDGFLGHSYVGAWVNIGAASVSSDLKNTYGSVRVPINGIEVDSGETFVGLLIGDHSKSAINVAFPSGAVVGFCANVAAPRSPKFAPSFSWIDGDTMQPYEVHRGLAVARRVLARRGRQMSPAAEKVFLQVARRARAIERWPAFDGIVHPG